MKRTKAVLGRMPGVIGMETANTQRASAQSEADRLSQEHSNRIRDLRKKQSEELQAVTDKHERDMKQAETAYRVELSSTTAEHARKLQELHERQATTMANLEKSSDMSLKQAQETYRQQADALRSQGERKLATIRESHAESEQNITRRVKS